MLRYFNTYLITCLTLKKFNGVWIVGVEKENVGSYLVGFETNDSMFVYVSGYTLEWKLTIVCEQIATINRSWANSS